jgi:hypothetical protein
MQPDLIDTAEQNVRGILALALEHEPARAAVIVYDRQCDLTMGIADAYRRCLPGAMVLDHDSIGATSVLDGLAQLTEGDLVVLIQTSRFRMETFRLRIELFRRSLKVIEHPHLGRMAAAEAVTYVDSLAYDRDYYRGVGQALQQRINQSRRGVLQGDGEQLVFSAGFEDAMLNVGDYSQMKNVGGQFPIGEVATESKRLEDLNGRVRIHAFGDREFHVNRPAEPITLVIEQGRVVEVIDSTPEFDEVLTEIRADEGEVFVREFGLGLNRAMTRERTVADIGSYERMCGVHLSLGSKHHIFKKPGIKKKLTKHHVDVFAVTDALRLDDEVVFQDGAWTVGVK